MTQDFTDIKVEDVRMRSRSVILENQHPSGAFPAAVGYPVYNYCWFRDGAFIADSLSRVGEVEAATKFHEWSRGVLEERRDHIMNLVARKGAGEHIPGSDMLPTRFTLEGDDGAEDWWDFQLDGYGTWLWALKEHIFRYDLDAGPFLPAVGATMAYLAAFGDHACFDWWEEFEEHRHLSTLCSIVAGLEAAGSLLTGDDATVATAAATRLRLLVEDSCSDSGHLTKWIGSNAVDGSLLSTSVPFAVFAPGSDIAEATYERIVIDLVAEGVYRYRGDTFYGGGEWINLTAWLGLYELATGRTELSLSRRDWIVGQATDIGDLPEQVSTRTQAPDRIQEWESRWGQVATPLLWSHAMFLTLDLALQQHGEIIE